MAPNSSSSKERTDVSTRCSVSVRRVVLLAGAGLALAACGSQSTPASQPAGPVATKDLPDVGTVLVDTSGRTMYFTDSEQTGMIRCTADCVSVWFPVPAPGNLPTDVAGLSTVTRPDGASQLAWQNKPLYTFKLDTADKPASGHNARDNFGGMDFTWHAAVIGPAQDNGGGSGGGGGY
jgi:predicted lipoprotein with Yx(FWY)xxD motif